MIFFYKQFLFVSFLVLVVLESSAQGKDLPNPPPDIQTITINSLIIAMDNAHQNLYLGRPFNIKAYGLVNALLQNDIPVKWVIKSGKAKDGIDFSANVERIYPSFVAASMEDFRASAFIIDSTFVNNPPYTGGQTATQIITAFGKNVAVYKLTANTTVDVRYTLNQRPKIACFNNGTYQQVQTKILDSAGIPNYVPINAGLFTGLAECYTFCSEAHWSIGSQAADSATMAPVWDFVNEGGNFLAQCAGIDKYENQMEPTRHFHTTDGVDFQNVTVINTYYNPDMAYNQFEGTVAPRSGTVASWQLSATSSYIPETYFSITSVTSDSLVAAAAHLASPDSAGSNVFYLGGHDYMTTTTTRSAVEQAGNLTYINGTRMYLNAALIPAKRPTPFVITMGPSSTICNGQQTTLSVTGPASATYIWSPSSGLTNPNSTNPVASPTSTTIYSVIADNGGCPANGTVTVTVLPTPVTPTATSNGPVCAGNTLSLSASTVIGATYNWSGPGGFSSSSQDTTITNASTVNVGTYSVTATVGGCSSPTAVIPITINSIPTTTVSPTNVSCFSGNNGSAIAIPSGGSPAYTYAWSDGQTTSSATGFIAANYSVTVTDSQGCTSNATVSITEPAVLTSTVSSTNVSCFGGNNGTAFVSPSGGTSAYTYLWNNGQTTSSVTGLIAANYSIAITDSKTCTTTATVSVTEPAAPLSSAPSQTNVSCFGGSNGTATVTAAGGTSAYTYLWSNGQTSSTSTGLIAGNYSVAIADMNGCTATAAFTVTEPIILSSTASQTNVCSGSSNGTAFVSTSGGTPSYTYLWNNGQTTSSATNLAAGNYSVTVTDSNGCTTTAAISITLFPAVSASFSQVNVSCFGGSNGTATVTVAGGTSPFTYFWNPIAATTSAATGLSVGNYTATVTDANGCTTGSSVSITQPAVLNTTTSSVMDTCGLGHGTSSVAVIGGTVPYTYSWNIGQSSQTATGLDVGNYTVVVTDVNGCTTINTVNIVKFSSPMSVSITPDDTVCQGQTVFISASINGGTSPYTYTWNQAWIGPGPHAVIQYSTFTYSVSVTDVYGCQSQTQVATMSVYSSSTVSGNNVSVCSGQSATLTATASGGTGGPYSYSWSNSISGQTQIVNVPVTQSPANFVVYVSDGCTMDSDTVVVTVKPLPVVLLNFNGDSGCMPLAVTFSATSDTGVTYLWNFGDTNNGTGNPVIHTYTTPGSYTGSLTATASNGCSVIATTSALIDVYPDPTAYFTTNPVVTPMPNDNPTINFSNQSLGAISYYWDFGDGATSTSADPGHHYPVVGFYTVTLVSTNQYGCKDTFEIQTTGEGDIVLPNAFTPNTSGSNGGGYNPFNLDNDVFFPFAGGVKEFHMTIFNRWGELIFETYDIKIGWDGYYRGKLCQQDVYVWKASAEFIDGRKVEKAGDVTLLR